MIVLRKEFEIEALYNGVHYLGSIYQKETDLFPRICIYNMYNSNEVHDFPVSSVANSAKETENYLRMAHDEGI